METIIIDAPSNWEDLKLHELCTLFPPMDDGDYDLLVESIKKIGFMETDPIILFCTNDGEHQVLDGRNRLNASVDAGIEFPEFAEFAGDEDELLPFVMARNVNRRHLTTGQKAAIASKLATLSFGDNQFSNGVTQKEAADKVQVGEASIRRFNFVKDKDPDLADKVASGEVALQTAREEVTDHGKLGDKRSERLAKLEGERQGKIEAKFNKLVIEIFGDDKNNPDNEEIIDVCKNFFYAGVDFTP